MSNPVGAARAITEKGADTVIVGMDHDKEALGYLKDGVIYCLGVQDCYSIGFDTIQVAVKIADGNLPGELYPEKTNEITAIPELVKLLDVSECVVSIDAMGCQKKRADAIREKDADYLLAVKGNQPTLNEGICEYMSSIEAGQEPEAIVDHWDSGYEKNHGRIERRRVTVCVCPE